MVEDNADGSGGRGRTRKDRVSGYRVGAGRTLVEEDKGAKWRVEGFEWQVGGKAR